MTCRRRALLVALLAAAAALRAQPVEIIELRHNDVRFEVAVLDELRLVGVLDNQVSVGERFVGRSLPQLEVVGDVGAGPGLDRHPRGVDDLVRLGVGMNEFDRNKRIVDGVDDDKILVFNPDPLDRLRSLFLGVRRDRRNNLTRPSHLPSRQGGLIAHERAVELRVVVTGHHCPHARHVPHAVDVQLRDPRVRHARSKHLDVQLVGEFNVDSVDRMTPGLGRGVNPDHRLADEPAHLPLTIPRRS